MDTLKFLGPFTITKVPGDLNYQLEAPGLRTEKVHYNRLLYFHSRETHPISEESIRAPIMDKTNLNEPENDPRPPKLIFYQIIFIIFLLHPSNLRLRRINFNPILFHFIHSQTKTNTITPRAVIIWQRKLKVLKENRFDRS